MAQVNGWRGQRIVQLWLSSAYRDTSYALCKDPPILFLKGKAAISMPERSGPGAGSDTSIETPLQLLRSDIQISPAQDLTVPGAVSVPRETGGSSDVLGGWVDGVSGRGKTVGHCGMAAAKVAAAPEVEFDCPAGDEQSEPHSSAAALESFAAARPSGSQASCPAASFISMPEPLTSFGTRGHDGNLSTPFLLFPRRFS